MTHNNDLRIYKSNIHQFIGHAKEVGVSVVYVSKTFNHGRRAGISFAETVVLATSFIRIDADINVFIPMTVHITVGESSDMPGALSMDELADKATKIMADITNVLRAARFTVLEGYVSSQPLIVRYE